MNPPRRIVDLSLPVDESTQVYPGDPEPRIGVATTIAQDGFNVLSLHLGSQTGTHVDAPYHFSEEGLRLDELDLGLFLGPAVLIEVPVSGPRERIGWERIAPYASQFERRHIAVLHTGWSAHYGTPRYFDNPFLDAEACRRMLQAGVRTFLLDAPNIDETPDAAHPGEGYPSHHLIADAGGVIGENLCHLEQIDFDPFISCLPIKLTGADGAPVRAVAFEL
ncbi:MAG: putative cyclase [Frankiales bacterium]|nr:putative cyclase [Frankiales bacterium]